MAKPLRLPTYDEQAAHIYHQIAGLPKVPNCYACVFKAASWGPHEKPASKPRKRRRR